MSITYKQLLKLRDVLESHQDDGPSGGGWASADLESLRGYFGEVVAAAERLALCINIERYRFEMSVTEAYK